MDTTTVTEFKEHFGYYINRVENGEEFTITRYGKPVVVITPASDLDVVEDEYYDDLIGYK